MSDTFVYVAAAIIGVVGTARLVRLVTADDFPPTVWWREHFMAWVGPVWGKLFSCLWCFSPYITAANLAWALLSDLHWTWWVFNGWMAASYAASWLVYHDEGDD